MRGLLTYILYIQLATDRSRIAVFGDQRAHLVVGRPSPGAPRSPGRPHTGCTWRTRPRSAPCHEWLCRRLPPAAPAPRPPRDQPALHPHLAGDLQQRLELLADRRLGPLREDRVEMSWRRRGGGAPWRRAAACRTCTRSPWTRTPRSSPAPRRQRRGSAQQRIGQPVQMLLGVRVRDHRPDRSREALLEAEYVASPLLLSGSFQGTPWHGGAARRIRPRPHPNAT